MSLNSGNRVHFETDFELNITPIVDCFTVLITFLLVSASFISFGVIDAGVNSDAVSSDQTAPSALSLTVEIRQNLDVALVVSGKLTRSRVFSKGKEKWFDAEPYLAELKSLKEKYPDTDMVTLSAANGVPYKNVVEVLEISRKVTPNVLLGGF